jgi:hypothetical protein
MTDAPTMDEICLNLLHACGALDENTDPQRSALRYAAACWEWPVMHREMVVGVAVGTAGVMAAHLNRGMAREQARELANAWEKHVNDALHDQDRAYIMKLLGNVQ